MKWFTYVLVGICTLAATEAKKWCENKSLRKKYYIKHQGATYQDSISICQTQGRIIAEPRTIQETDCIKSFDGGFFFYIGLTDIKKEGEWRWTSDDSLASKDELDFAQGQPDNGPGENCIIVKQGEMHDTHCNNKNNEVKSVICETCLDGTFGDSCSKDCRCKDNVTCNKTTGRCPSGCLGGWQGEDCQTACVDGTFGDSCSKDCHCKDKVACNQATGRCPSDCLSGWLGDDCQTECDDGKFGQNCSKDCHCKDKVACNKTTGRCPSDCLSGWQGNDCQKECPDGKWGELCAKDCNCQEICNKQTGSCPSQCEIGLIGDRCQQACSSLLDCGIHNTSSLNESCVCVCVKGYTNENARKCVDVDECSDQTHDCGEEECINKPGSYECEESSIFDSLPVKIVAIVLGVAGAAFAAVGVAMLASSVFGSMTGNNPLQGQQGNKADVEGVNADEMKSGAKVTGRDSSSSSSPGPKSSSSSGSSSSSESSSSSGSPESPETQKSKEPPGEASHSSIQQADVARPDQAKNINTK